MQLTIVYIIIAFAAAYIVYAIVRRFCKKDKCCGGCEGCALKEKCNKF